MTSKPRPIMVFLAHVGLAVAALVFLLPFVWVLAASLREGDDLTGSFFLPRRGWAGFTFENYGRLWREQSLLSWLVNSVFLSSTHTVVVVLLSSLGGFALAKYRFRGQRGLTLVMVATMMLPSQVMLPGLREMIDRFGWMNSYLAVLMPGFVSVFGMFLFRQAFAGVPDELLAAGRVDGCSEWRLWWNVALPCVRPMLGAYSLMAFLSSWNSYLWPQLVLQDEGKYTLPIALSNMVSLPEFQSAYGVLMAGTVISVVPVMVLFLAMQRDFVAGLTSGAMKG